MGESGVVVGSVSLLVGGGSEVAAGAGELIRAGVVWAGFAGAEDCDVAALVPVGVGLCAALVRPAGAATSITDVADRAPRWTLTRVRPLLTP